MPSAIDRHRRLWHPPIARESSSSSLSTSVPRKYNKERVTDPSSIGHHRFPCCFVSPLFTSGNSLGRRKRYQPFPGTCPPHVDHRCSSSEEETFICQLLDTVVLSLLGQRFDSTNPRPTISIIREQVIAPNRIAHARSIKSDLLQQPAPKSTTMASRLNLPLRTHVLALVVLSVVVLVLL